MVAVGLTVVEPVAAVEVKVPGVMAMLVAPVTDQFKVLLEPDVIVPELAVKELMVGLVGAGFTVTVAVAVIEPVVLVAVRV